MDNPILTYYQGIQDKSIVVGQWVRLLYEELIRLLESKEAYYNAKEADKAIQWIESHCFHTEGPLAPGPLVLELWQKALVAAIFGIYDSKTNKRRYREIVLVVARKNGKSILASAIARYIWALDGGFGARVYCVAPKLDQAAIVYDQVWMMTQLDPEWQELRDLIQSSKDEHNKKTEDDSLLARHRQGDLFIPGTNCQVKKLAYAARRSDGFSPSLTICDEVAAWEGDKGLKQYEVMKSAMGARDMGDKPGLLLSCTTAGYIHDGIYDELFKRSTRVLLGDSKETRLLPVLYTIDDVEKWNDINELRKSNPNLGVSVTIDYLLEEIAIAEGSLSKQAEFITKYANIKQNSSQAFLSVQAVEKCCGEPLRLEDYEDHYAIVGIDLSQTTDLTAAVCLVEDKGELYAFAKFWLPGAKIEEATARDGMPYGAYIKRGILEPSGDNFIDYHDCFNWVTSLVQDHKILPLRVGYDRYSAQYLVKDLEAFGFVCEDVWQGTNLYPTLQEAKGLIDDAKIHIGDNDLLKAHLLDSAIKMDIERGRGRLVKVHHSRHIDGMAALTDALCLRGKYWAEIGPQLMNE